MATTTNRSEGFLGLLMPPLPFGSLQPHSASNSFRAKRFEAFAGLVADVVRRKGQCRILDVGGTSDFWKAFGERMMDGPVTVTLLNVRHSGQDHDVFKGKITEVVGDACDMSDIESDAFDVIHSNSVIEHVGQWPDMERMASEIRRVSPAYFVQTPAFWFPMEPHARTLFLHMLPEPMKVSMMLRRKRGFWSKATNVAEATRSVQSAHLLDYRQVSYLFPDAKIYREKMFGLTKSYFAVRRRRPGAA